jgi:hypothetical protein
MNLIFFDIDGVICTSRAALTYGALGHRQLDPIPMGFLRHVCKHSPTKLVCISSWATSADVRTIFMTHGFDYSNFHDEWKIDDIYDRSKSIIRFLERPIKHETNALLRYALDKDDDDYQYAVLHGPHRHVKCDTYDGLSFHNMSKIIKLLCIEKIFGWK